MDDVISLPFSIDITKRTSCSSKRILTHVTAYIVQSIADFWPCVNTSDIWWRDIALHLFWSRNFFSLPYKIKHINVSQFFHTRFDTFTFCEIRIFSYTSLTFFIASQLEIVILCQDRNYQTNLSLRCRKKSIFCYTSRKWRQIR